MKMALYGISVAVLAEQLKRKFPSPMQVWYADDFSTTASGRAAQPLMKRLGEIGPWRGVFPEPAKSQYIRSAQVTEEAARDAAKGTTVQHEAGSRTLGGHIGSPEIRDTWITRQVSDWAEWVKALGRIATRFPKTAYAGLVKALQNEWTYLQQTTTGSGSLYTPIEKVITEDFLPALLGQATTGQTMRNQTALAVKRAGLGIPNPTTTTGENYSASIDCSELLVESLLTGEPINIVAHQKHAT